MRDTRFAFMGGFRRRASVVCGLAALAFLFPVARAEVTREAGRASRDIHNFTTNVEDIEATVRVTKYEPKELEKIGKDFGTTYLFRTLTFQYKQPDKIRLEGSSRVLGSALFILNGPNRFFNVPKLGRKSRENLEKAPGKRQSLLEYGGLLSPDTLRFMRGRFLREEIVDGTATPIYELTYPGSNGGSFHQVWIDPKTRITVKRAWFDGEKNLRATFTYLEPREVENGVWMPTRVEVKNSDGTLAASSTFDDIKINKGLDDSLFAIAP